MTIDLDAYFARIGYQGDRRPTLMSLNAIARAHIENVPFENLDVLLGRPISLELGDIERKLVGARRGGYCFEQNTLMAKVLEQLGFSVRLISARVRYQRPRDFTPARTHTFVRVELDEPYLVDVGVGAMSPTAALRLNSGDPQPTPHETRRLLRENGLIYHQALLGSEWADICEFTLEEMPPIDRIVGNWFTSTHPDSHFRNRLLVARAGPDGSRFSVLNDELSIRNRDGHAMKTAITSPVHLLEVLQQHFGLHFEPGTVFKRLEVKPQ